jgi:hypothetical protein
MLANASEETTENETPMSDTSSRGWQPATYYPDPAIHALDPRFEKYWIKLGAIERIATGMRWAEGPVWFGDGRYLLCSDIPNNRIIKWEEETGAISDFRKTIELRQWQHAGSPGTPDHLRTRAPDHTHRI